MNVLFLSPHYPPEMQHFTRGLAEVGAQVYAVGDAPEGALPAETRRYLSGYLQVSSWGDESQCVAEVLSWLRHHPMHRVETLWEPLVMLAARLREKLGAPGISPEVAHRFRDKVEMNSRVEAAGLRTPRSRRARSVDGVLEAVEALGYPLCIKPIAGAGSKDTYRVNDTAELKEILPRLRHVPEVSVEEFITGREYTFDALWHDGRLAFHSITQYLPPPLQARSQEWISPAQLTFKDPDADDFDGAKALAEGVVQALGMRDGFTHMEWFRTEEGEVVFGEIAARNGGGHLVDMMNFANDADLFRGWAQLLLTGQLAEPIHRRYHVGLVFKRAQGQGRISAVEGLDEVWRRCGEHLVWENLLPIGAQRRDWRNTLVSDGFVCVRHPRVAPVLEMIEVIVSRLKLYAQ